MWEKLIDQIFFFAFICSCKFRSKQVVSFQLNKIFFFFSNFYIKVCPCKNRQILLVHGLNQIIVIWLRSIQMIFKKFFSTI